MAKHHQYFPQSRPHPGETLAEKLSELEMGPKEFALRTGKPEKTIIALLQGESALTPDMAVQFESVTKVPAHFWMNHQRAYDESIAREKRRAVILEAQAWAKQFPLVEMVKKGWLPPVQTLEEKTIALLNFFGFSTHMAWEDYYCKQQLKVAFRISLAHSKQPYALSAWLRQGELQAATLQAPDYSERKLKEALPQLKSLMATHPPGFFNALQSLCLQAGVKVVHTPCISKAPISGATRWLNNTPLIQLSGRYNRNDVFWFTFFHEAGHVLLHGKKDIFLEQLDYAEKDHRKEQEADDFAVRWIFSASEEAEVLKSNAWSDPAIKAFASKFKTHPAVIVGRLQHKGLLPYSVGSKFVEPVVFD
jgi:addiction module HigA family antidote